MLFLCKLSIVNPDFNFGCAETEAKDSEWVRHATSNLCAKIPVIEPPGVDGTTANVCLGGVFALVICHDGHCHCWHYPCRDIVIILVTVGDKGAKVTEGVHATDISVSNREVCYCGKVIVHVVVLFSLSLCSRLIIFPVWKCNMLLVCYASAWDYWKRCEQEYLGWMKMLSWEESSGEKLTNFVVCRVTTPVVVGCLGWDDTTVTWHPVGKCAGSRDIALFDAGGGVWAQGAIANVAQVLHVYCILLHVHCIMFAALVWVPMFRQMLSSGTGIVLGPCCPLAKPLLIEVSQFFHPQSSGHMCYCGI